MNIDIKELTKAQWKEISYNAHKATFNAESDPEKERIDFALLAIDTRHNSIIGYVTCRESDADTVYWQYGGSLPSSRASVHILKAYQLMINYCGLKYKRMTTLIENTNKAMLKMAAHVGLIITGVRTYNGKVLLEHEFKFGGA